MLKSRQNNESNSTARSVIGDQAWRPPGGEEDVDRWAPDNRTALEQYAQRNEKHGTAAEQLERFLAAYPEGANGKFNQRGF
jgi:hypothetical protein